MVISMLKSFTDFVKENKIFVLVVILAAAVRFVAINQMPPSLNWDEVSHGYNAYSILKTGKDEWGFTFPTIFRAYGDYKLPVYIYLTAISEFFFGLNEFAVRLPSVLAGIGTVVFTYFLVLELFSKNELHRGRAAKYPADSSTYAHSSSPQSGRGVLEHNKNQSLAYLAALLVAIEPWSLFLSRGAFEANLGLFLFVGGVFFFLKGLKNQRLLVLSSLFFGLTIWTYNSYRVFTASIIFVLLIIYRKELSRIYETDKKLVTYCFLLIALFFVPMFYQLLNPIGQARYGRVEILDEGAIAQINELRSRNELPPFFSRLLYNKGTYFTQRVIKNYFSHFSPNYLFFEGGTHYQFSVPGQGLIYPINLIFFMIGLLYLIRKRSKSSWFFLCWLLLAPIPSSLTREAPHVLRSIVTLPIPMILTAFGLLKTYSWFKSKFIIYLLPIIYLIILAGFVENYLNIYFTDYKKNYSWAWQYGYKEMVKYVKSNYSKYDKIIVSKKYGEPHEFFLFYGGAGALAPWPWDPEKYRNDPNLIRFYQSSWYWVDGFDKFYFVNDWQIPKSGNQFVLESKKTVDCQTEGCLLITSPNNYPSAWEKLETIKFLDGKPAFEILGN